MDKEIKLDYRFSGFPDFKIAPGHMIFNFELRAVMIFKDPPFISDIVNKPEYKIYTKSDFTTYFPGSIPDMWTINDHTCTQDHPESAPVLNVNSDSAARILFSIISNILSANNLSIPITI